MGRHCRDACHRVQGNCSVFTIDQKPLQAKSWTLQVLCSMDGQITQSTDSVQFFQDISLLKLLLKKVLSSTPIKIRQNLKMNAMLEIAYITNLFLIGTINKNTYQLKNRSANVADLQEISIHYLQIRQSEYRKFYTFGSYQVIVCQVVYLKLILRKTGKNTPTSYYLFSL